MTQVRLTEILAGTGRPVSELELRALDHISLPSIQRERVQQLKNESTNRAADAMFQITPRVVRPANDPMIAGVCGKRELALMRQAHQSASSKIIAGESYESWRDERDVLWHWLGQRGCFRGGRSAESLVAEDLWQGLFELRDTYASTRRQTASLTASDA